MPKGEMFRTERDQSQKEIRNQMNNEGDAIDGLPNFFDGVDFIDRLPATFGKGDYIDNLPDFASVAEKLQENDSLGNLRKAIDAFNEKYAGGEAILSTESVLYAKVDSLIYKELQQDDVTPSETSRDVLLSDIKEVLVNKAVPELVKTVAYFGLIKSVMVLNYGSEIFDHYLGKTIDTKIVEEINTFYKEVITPDYIKNNVPELQVAPEELATGLADLTCKAVDAALYLTGKIVAGALGVVEDVIDYVGGTVAGLSGHEEITEALYSAEISKKISQKIDDLYNGPDVIRELGNIAEVSGHIAAFIGASILEVAEGGVIALVCAGLVGLARAGDTVRDDIQEKGQYANVMALHGAFKAVITAISVKIVGEIHDFAATAYKEAVKEVTQELASDSVEFLIARLIVGTENAFAAGAAGGVVVSVGDILSDLFGKLVDAKDDFEVKWREIVKNAAVGGAVNATMFVAKDGVKDVDRFLTEASIRPLSEDEIKNLQDKLGWSDKKIRNNCTIDKKGTIHYKTTNQHLEGGTSINGIPYKRVRFVYNGVTIEGVFPDFDSMFDVKLDVKDFKSNAYAKICNAKLAEAVKENPDLRDMFTADQLKDIENGLTPRDFVWHHNQEPGKMQLVKRVDHDKTLYPNADRNAPAHTGGSSLWGPDSVERVKNKVEDF